MPYKDPEKFKEMHKRYNQVWKRRRTESRMKAIDEKIGKQCFICSATYHLHTHRKDGKQHKDIKDMTKAEFEFLISHPELFVRLCRGCHHYVHWCMKWLSMSWEEIESRIKG